MKTNKFQLIELVKDISYQSGGQRLYFQDQPQLRATQGRDVQILAIEAYSDAAIPVSQNGNTVVTEAGLKNAFLVLNIAGTEDLQFIPLVRLNPMHVDTDTTPFNEVLQFQLENVFNVDWTKSYVQFGGAPAAGPYSFLFGVYYKLMKAGSARMAA